MNCANTTVVAFLHILESVVLECQSIGATCSRFDFVECISGSNMALYINNNQNSVLPQGCIKVSDIGM